jgi:predicted nucleic acid-binding protein
MEIVVNEWLLDYMCPSTQLQKISMAIKFINGLVKKCDKMVIGRATPFASKFYCYMKRFGWDIDFKKRYAKLNYLLFRNSDKTIIIEKDNVNKLPKEIEEKIPVDDKYLIELVYSSRDRIILTTDGRLKEKLKDEVDLKICLLEEFLQEYLS